MNVEDVVDRFTDMPADNDAQFRTLLDTVLDYQRSNGAVYSRFCASFDPDELVYLPVDAFRLSAVATFPVGDAEAVFHSSGTTAEPSRHYVKDLSIYRRSVVRHFVSVFGRGPFLFLAHLPDYDARGNNSSLVAMARILVDHVGVEGSGLFLRETDALTKGIGLARDRGLPVVLLGAAFGLLDLLDAGVTRLPHDAIVIETGGMKTNRREVGRHELHCRLANGFGTVPAQIYSEYGMCELLSQLYTRGGTAESVGETFFPPPWVRCDVRRTDNPITCSADEDEVGLLAVADLANVHSCSAILTGDLARRDGEGFRILGRAPGAVMRGCNFLIEDALYDHRAKC